MSDDLSRKIALAHEPEPTQAETRALMAKNWSQSPKGWWALARHSGQPVDDIESYYWRPDSGPIVTLRLLEDLMAFDSTTLIAIRGRYDYLKRNVHDSVGLCSVIQGPDLKEAIARAWLTWKGIQ